MINFRRFIQEVHDVRNIYLKGKHLLAVESKEREVEGLKETFKNLQVH